MTPEKTLLIVAHGQPSEPDPPEVHLAALARQVAEHLPGWQVRGATMAKPGALEAAAEVLGSGVLIYPFFMGDGWFIRTALPRRLTGFDIRMLDPFGLDPNLPGLTAGWLTQEIALRGWDVAQSHVMIAAHGSGRSDRPAQIAGGFAEALSTQLPLAGVTCGFVEQDPRMADVARDLGSQALCLPFFALAGGHVRDDIPEAMNEAGFQGAVLPVLGDHPDVPKLIAAAALVAGS